MESVGQDLNTLLLHFLLSQEQGVGEQRRKLLHYHLQKGVACRWFEALKTEPGGGPPGGDLRAGWSLEQPGT